MEPSTERVVGGRRRHIALAGNLNFRDLGGYRTGSGGTTRWGRLFRSDSLHRCNADDFAAMDRLGPLAIYDLRRNDEIEQHPNPRDCIHVPIPSRRVADTDPLSLQSRSDAEQWIFEDYCGMLDDGGPAFGRLFRLLAQPDGIPGVFHCLGGKDRTGMAAALLLTALGVDRETVLDDYHLTNIYGAVEQLPDVVDSLAALGIGRAAAEALLTAPRWAMAAALDLLDSRYGGIETYLRDRANVTDRDLRSLRERLVSS